MKKNKANKVLFIIPSFELGGAEIQTLNHVNYLYDRGYDPYLVILSKIDTLSAKLLIPKDQILIITDNPSPLFNISSIFRIFKFIPVIARFIARHDVATVFAVMNLSHFVGRFAKLYLRLTGREVFLVIYHRCAYYKEFPANTLAKKIFNIVNSWISRVTDNKNIFISKNVEIDIVANTFVCNPTVIYNSVKPVNIDLHLATEYLQRNHLTRFKFFILFPGRFHAHKGHAMYINVMTRLIKDLDLVPGSVITILAGAGELEVSIKDKIEENNLSEYFHFSGMLSHELLLSLFTYSNLIVVPSLHEGFGNVAVEALMTGSLLLCSDAGGLGEIIKDNYSGIVFKNGDEEALYEKLKMILLNNGEGILNFDVVRKAFESRFTLAVQMKKLIEIIDRD